MARKQAAARRPQAANPKPSRPWLPVALLVLVAVVSGYAFLAPGHPATVDVWPQLSRIKMVFEALRHGTSPFHSFMFYCGYPSLRFYSPLFHLIGGFLAIFTGGNMLLAARVLLYLLHLASALAMYKYLRRVNNSLLAAALGTLVYLVVPWRVLYLAISGAYPPALLYLLIPLLLLSLEKLRTGAGPRQALLLGFLFSLTLLSHVVYALFVALFLLLFIVLSPRPARDQNAPTRFPWTGLLIAAATALVLSAWFVVPFLLEYRAHQYPEPSINIPPPDIRVLLGLKQRVGGYAGAYLGISNVILVLLAVAGALRPVKGESRRNLFALAGLVLTLLFIFAPRLLGASQVLYTAGLSSERFLLFFTFFAALLVPAAFAMVERLFLKRKWSPGFAFVLIACIVLVDCLPGLVKVAFDPADEVLAVRQDIYRELAPEKPVRLLDMNVPLPKIDDVRRTCRYPSLAYIYGNLPSPLGPHYNQFAPRSMRYVYPFVNELATDIGATATDSISPRSLKAIALMGTSHVLTLPGLVEQPGNQAPLMKLKQGINWDDKFVRAQAQPPLAIGRTSAGLVLASNTVLPLPQENLVAEGVFFRADDWQELLDTLEVDPAARRLNFIPATDGQPAQSLPGLPSVRVVASSITNSATALSIETDVECFLRIAVSYYPELAVAVDNRPVRFHETKDHFIYIRCPAGQHRISVTAPPTALRVVSQVLSLLGLVGFGLAMLLLRRRRA